MRERECIRYAIYKTSGATPTEACRLFGFENMRARASHVDTCIKEMQEIYEAVESLVHIQEQALQDTLGFESNSSESSDEEMDFTFSSSQFGSSSSPIDVPDDASLAAILCGKVEMCVVLFYCYMLVSVIFSFCSGLLNLQVEITYWSNPHTIPPLHVMVRGDLICRTCPGSGVLD